MASPTHGHEFWQTLGDDEGQGSLAWCSPWGHKESDTTEHLNNRMPMPTVCAPDFAQSSDSSSHPEEVQRDPARIPRLKLVEDSVLKGNFENSLHSGSLFTSMVASQIKLLPFYAIFFCNLQSKEVSFYAFKANLDRRRGGWALYYSLLSKDIRSHYFMANRGRKGGSGDRFPILEL